MGNEPLALVGLRTTRIAQNGGHFGVSEAGMAPHDGGIELVRVQLAVFRDEHVAHHAKALHLGVQGTQTVG